MKERLSQFIEKHLHRLEITPPQAIVVEVPNAKDHGDFSTNVAMVLAKSAGMKPRDLAQKLVDSLASETDFLKKVEVKGPGFINFFLQDQAYHSALASVWDNKKQLKINKIREKSKVLIEFVSANPTGPMHVGHGRNAVVGDSLARLMEAVGYEVTREFYINDHGVQIHTLGRSGSHYHHVIAQVGEVQAALPEDMYRGEYLEKLVAELHDELTPIKDDPMAVGKRLGVALLEVIKQDLKAVGVEFENYFSESSLYEAGEIDGVLEQLKSLGHTYEQEQALWFRTSEFGDDKDRVLIKSDNSYTYFTPDIAYHQDKFSRNYDIYINVMGADHGGYVKRMKAAVQALGYNPEQLEFLLMQLVSLKRGGEVVAMSKRSGDYVTLRDVVEEVGSDATRFFFMLRSHHSTLDFDLELAKKHSSDNPVFYVQYAHARMCSIFAKAQAEGHSIPKPGDSVDLSSLTLPEELELVKRILDYPDVLCQAAREREPHRVAFYLMELAKVFQNYYTQGKTDERYRVLDQAQEKVQAKLYLLLVLREVFRLCLNVLGVSAPEQM